MTVVLREWETFAGSNTPVVGATVNARVASSTHPSAAAIVASTTTNASGMWEFTALADATYDVDITYNGRTRWRKGLSLFSNAIAGSNFATQTANKVFAGPASGAAATPTFRDAVSDDFPAGLWSTQAPSSVSQLSGVAFTTNSARKFRLGKFVNYVVQITLSAATGTTANPILVVLPFTMNNGFLQALGTFVYVRASGPVHTGIVANYNNGGDIAFMVPTLTYVGISPAFAEAVGDVLRFSISGETT